MIPDETVEEVRLRADIVEFIGEHVTLKKSGKEFKALCPFHREKTPSFYVVPDKGFYKCFGCGESGDLFSFLTDHAGMSFPDAVREVAARVGVEIPDERADAPEEDPHRALREALAFAADFYQRNLLDDDAGEAARRYLNSRGIGGEFARDFMLGYAPDAWRSLREAAHRHGIEDEVLLAAGLVKTSDRMDEPYDAFRNRIIFPIRDPGGRVIAFGGRIIGAADPRAPKYLNSPETPVYHKGSILYGLHHARRAIRREEKALVVEGYMDYVSLASRGIENVVAPLGTALTPEQAGLLGRYTSRALLLFDSDAAGLRATFRSGDALLAAGVHPLAVMLPEGEDPDSVVHAGGAEALRPFLRDAVDVLDRKLQILEEYGLLERIDGLRRALDKVLPTLRAVTDPALRDLYVARVAERTGIRAGTIQDEIEAAPARAGRRRRGEGGARGDGASPRGEREPGGWRSGGDASGELVQDRSGERELLVLLLRDARLVPDADEALDAEDFADPVHREIFEALVAAGGVPAEGVPDDDSSLGLSEAAEARLGELRADPGERTHGDRIFRDTVAFIRGERLRRRLEDLERRMDSARLKGDQEALERLYRERAEIGALGRWHITRRDRRSD